MQRRAGVLPPPLPDAAPYNDQSSPSRCAPLVLVHEHAAELGEPVRKIIERGQDDRPLVEREREQLHFVAQSPLEPLGELDPRRPS